MALRNKNFILPLATVLSTILFCLAQDTPVYEDSIWRFWKEQACMECIRQLFIRAYAELNEEQRLSGDFDILVAKVRQLEERTHNLAGTGGNLDNYTFHYDFASWGMADSTHEVAIVKHVLLQGETYGDYCVTFSGYKFLQSIADIMPWQPHEKREAQREASIRCQTENVMTENGFPTLPSLKLGFQGNRLVVELPGGQCLTMVRIPAGKYLKGGSAGESRDIGRQRKALGEGGEDLESVLSYENSQIYGGFLPEDEKFYHEAESQGPIVIAKDFWLGMYEVTEKQSEAVLFYQEFLLDSLSQDTQSGTQEQSNGGIPMDMSIYDREPWGSVPFNSAWVFCEALNRFYAERLPDGYCFAIPWEAQWEYACRAGTVTELNNGTDLNLHNKISDNLNQVGWYQGNSHGYVQLVGQKQPNAWELYDMHGNLAEWCIDRVRPMMFMTECLPDTGESHILRGGAFNAQAEACCSSARASLNRAVGTEFTGFRLALIPKELAPEFVPKPNENHSSAEPCAGAFVAELPAGFRLVLAKIPAGRFMMGSPESEAGRPTLEYWQTAIDWATDKASNFHRHTDENQREVVIPRDFWLGCFEVTRGQYAAVIGADLSKLGHPDRPVTQVRWTNALAFCEKLNELCADQLPEGYHFALPTEEQWEYACRAGTTTALNSGKDLTQPEFYCPNLAEVGWFQINSGEHKHEVGLLKPNAWGLYDMHGNVWEWCRCTAPVDDDPLSTRILRGGSWYDAPRFCRSAMRRWLDEDRGGPDIGFRVALVPVEK